MEFDSLRGSQNRTNPGKHFEKRPFLKNCFEKVRKQLKSFGKKVLTRTRAGIGVCPGGIK